MPARFELKGVFVPIVTPMRAGGAVDTDAIPKLLDTILAAGVSGIVTCGGTGEFAALAYRERRHVTEIVVMGCSGRVPVIVQTGCVSTRDTVMLSRHAADSGAAALMVAPPFYDRLSLDELVEHYQAVARAVDLPIILYNNPAATGIDLTPELVQTLSMIDGVRFVKDSTGSAAAVATLIQQVGDRVSVANGADALALPALQMGASALIWGAANFMPALCVRLYGLALGPGGGDQAVALWRSMLPLITFLETSPAVATVKAGCKLVGYDVGVPRPPLLPLTQMSSERLAELLGGLGLLANA